MAVFTEDSGPPLLKQTYTQWAFCWLAWKKLSSAVLINADPQVNFLSRTAWLELLPGIWKQARDVISLPSEQ